MPWAEAHGAAAMPPQKRQEMRQYFRIPACIRHQSPSFGCEIGSTAARWGAPADLAGRFIVTLFMLSR